MYRFEQARIDKNNALREEGINPYPAATAEPTPIAQLLEQYSEKSVLLLDVSPTDFCVAGRLRFKNEMGKLGFGRVESEGARIQICVKKNVVGEEQFKVWKKLDVGDWVLIREAGLFRTRTGELTLDVKQFSLLSKCLEGMPDKVSGVTDPETRQRMRYLDLIVNQDSREIFEQRSRAIKTVRTFLDDRGFMEVETPILQVLPGGASARPFTTHHNALSSDLYMRVAPELYLKRLVVGGFERVFEIGKNFRNEGVDTKHNPEFTMVEFYQAHANYRTLMELVRSLFNRIFHQKQLPFGEYLIDYSDWREKTYEQALMEVGVEDPWEVDSYIRFYNQKNGSFGLPSLELSDLQQRVFDEFIEPNLINPTFITKYPLSFSPLARQSDEDPRVTDRFELFIAGTEVANGFTELNDPVEQARRFAQQARQKAQGDDEAMFFDQDYIKALTYGMPPTGGCGIGIDRLVMLLVNRRSIRDVILFPTMKTK